MDENTKKLYLKYGFDPEERERENQELVEKRYKKLDALNKSILKKEFEEGLRENFDRLKYFLRETRFYYFLELQSNIWQIVQCLITKSYSASITLTNHVLERTFKLALIQNEAGVSPVDFRSWNETYRPTHKYSSWDLIKTIAECEKLGLITSLQQETLTEYRRSLRNGFSHYDPSAILRSDDDIKEMVMHDIKDNSKNQTWSINFKEIPMLQHHYVEKFAEENAQFYFEYVFGIIQHIERQFKQRYWNESRK